MTKFKFILKCNKSGGLFFAKIIERIFFVYLILFSIFFSVCLIGFQILKGR